MSKMRFGTFLEGYVQCPSTRGVDVLRFGPIFVFLCTVLSLVETPKDEDLTLANCPRSKIAFSHLQEGYVQYTGGGSFTLWTNC